MEKFADGKGGEASLVSSPYRNCTSSRSNWLRHGRIGEWDALLASLSFFFSLYNSELSNPSEIPFILKNRKVE